MPDPEKLPRYIVHAGYVLDEQGNPHYLTPEQVAEGFGLPMEDCLLVNDVKDYREKTRGLPYHQMQNYHPPIKGFTNR